MTRNLILMESLKDILEIFEKENIGSVVLKGASYLSFVYDRETDREMTDVDLFVDKNDLARIYGIMGKLGYERMPSSRSAFWKGTRIPVIVDLHTNLWYEPQPEVVWTHSVACVIENQKTRVLDWEEMILFHVVHALAQHGEWDARAEEDLKHILMKANGKLRWDLLRSRAFRTHSDVLLEETLAHMARRHSFRYTPPLGKKPWNLRKKVLRFFTRRILEKGHIPFADYCVPLLIRPSIFTQKFLHPPEKQNSWLGRFFRLTAKTIQGFWNLLR